MEIDLHVFLTVTGIAFLLTSLIFSLNIILAVLRIFFKKLKLDQPF